MHKNKFKKQHLSFFTTLFHKPLLIFFVIILLPFLVWGAQQTQLFISFGKNIHERKTNLLPQQQSPCPTTSNQTYSSIGQSSKLNFDPAVNAETNLYMRGWYEVNESRELVSRHGDNYGLDPNMPPQISTLFTNHYPKIIKTYRINAWDYVNQHNIPGESATPAYSVHMLGLEALPGESLVGLKAGRTIDGTNVFHVQYATRNSILFIHGAGEDDGYPYFFLDICVDPNLLATYERDNSAGRNQLPAVATGQVFGYAATNEVKFVIRDTGSFMDTRYKEDWWEYGGFKPDFIPTQIPTSLPIPTSTIIPTSPPSIATVTPIPTQTVIPTSRPISPTQTQVQITLKPFLPTPTTIPTPTVTPTPKPMVNIKNTIETARSVWTYLFNSFIRFTKVILP